MPRPHPDEYHEHKTGVKSSSKKSSKSRESVRSLDDYLLDLENQAIDAEYGLGGGGGSSGGGGGGSSGSLNALKSFKEIGNKTIGDVYANVQNQMNASADKVAADYAAGSKGAQDAYAPVAPNLNTASQQIQAAQSGTGVAGSSASAALEAQINAGIQAQIQNTIAKQATTGAAALATAQNREQGMTAAARQSATSAPFYRDKALSKFNSQIDLDIAKAGASSGGGGGGGGGGGSSSKEGKAQAKRIRAYEKYLKSKGKQSDKQQAAQKKATNASGIKGMVLRSREQGHGDVGESLANIIQTSGGDKDTRDALIKDYIESKIYGEEKQVPTKYKKVYNYNDGRRVESGEYSDTAYNYLKDEPQNKKGKNKAGDYEVSWEPVSGFTEGKRSGGAGKRFWGVESDKTSKYRNNVEKYIAQLLQQYRGY